MHTFKYPISIDGKNYYVGRNMNGAPTIYRGTKFTHRGHINEDPGVHGFYYVNEPGGVIIVARETDDDFKSLNGLLNGEMYKLRPITKTITFQFQDENRTQKEFERLGGEGSIDGFADGSRVVVPLPRSFNDREAVNTLGHEVLHVLFPNVGHYDDLWERLGGRICSECGQTRKER